MMSVATTELSRSTQHLIDSRLDTIDRMLLGRVPRQERIEIVREVEAQIFEQLHERGADEWSRDDVLAVLGRLDPPEAYLPEHEGDLGPVPSHRPSGPRAGHVPPMRRGDPRIAKASGILGLVSLAMFLSVPALYLIALTITSALFFFSLGGPAFALSLLGGIVAIVFATCSRLCGAWAVVGMVTGILSVIGLLGLTALTLVMGGL